MAAPVLVGGLTNCCVRHTATSAKEAGYRIYTVPDADVDRSREDHEKGLEAPGYLGLLTLPESIRLLQDGVPSP